MRHVQDLIKFYSLLANLEEVEGLVINPDVRAEHGVYQLEVKHALVADAEMATTAASTPTTKLMTMTTMTKGKIMFKKSVRLLIIFQI
jgi:hypothetical protein